MVQKARGREGKGERKTETERVSKLLMPILLKGYYFTN
jgi:hypothetical protein